MSEYCTQKRSLHYEKQVWYWLFTVSDPHRIQLSLNRGKREIQAEKTAEKQKTQDLSVAADGQALKEDCYYLKSLNGYVVVYLNDKKTVYEYTDIPLDGLPETLQQEIHNGKYVETSAALYGFLENYSS